MNRRNFITTSSIAFATAGLAGCSSTVAEDEEPREDPEFKTGEADWTGGSRQTQEYYSQLRYEDHMVGITGATAHTRVGVYSGEEWDNQENIPDDDFDWFTADKGNYLWTVGVEAIPITDSEHRVSPKGDIHTVIDPEEWSAIPILPDDGQEAVIPYSAVADEEPKYIRTFLTGGGTDTRHAYPTDGGHYDRPDLLFDVNGSSLVIQLGNPVQGNWSYQV